MKRFLVLLFALSLFGCQKHQKTLKIAFGSCAKQWEEQAIWKIIDVQNPDLFLFLGDAIYGDWDGEKTFTVTDSSLASDWKKLYDNPFYETFSDSVPILATWDNHDYGSYDGGRSFDGKEMAKKHFLQTFGIANDPSIILREGIYQSRYMVQSNKTIQIILLDTKWFRTDLCISDSDSGIIGSAGKFQPCMDDSSALLGTEQWKWLLQELKRPAQVRLICSSTQVIPNQKRMDEWGLFPRERTKLLNKLSEAGGTPVILSGNVHFAEISKINIQNKEIYEVTSSGLTHTDSRYSVLPNKYRDGDYCDELNFGVIDLDEFMEELHIQIKNEQGVTIIQKSISLDQ